MKDNGMASEIQTTINEIVSIFNESLEALVPSLVKARLVDLSLEGYDGWDAIVEALFKAIVEDSIRWSLPSDEMEKFSLPRYGFDPESISDKSYLRVVSSGVDEIGSSFCFIEFTSSPKFSGAPKLVTARELAKTGELGEFRVLSFEKCIFSCSYFFNGSRKEIDFIVVQN